MSRFSLFFYTAGVLLCLGTLFPLCPDARAEMPAPDVPLYRSAAWQNKAAQLLRYQQNRGDAPSALRLNSRPVALAPVSPRFGTGNSAPVFPPVVRSGVHANPAVSNAERVAPLFTGQPDWRTITERAGRANGVEAALLAAVIQAESGFNPVATSPKGALGAMQIMPETGRELGLVNFFDPDANVDAGARYLAAMLRQFGRLDVALAAYNAGPGAVQQFGGIPPYPETQVFVARVMDAYNKMSLADAYSAK